MKTPIRIIHKDLALRTKGEFGEFANECNLGRTKFTDQYVMHRKRNHDVCTLGYEKEK